MEHKDRLIASFSVDGRYRLLVEAITDYAIYMLDPAGVVTSWNPGAERFKGYSSSEIIGQHFSRFYTEEDRATGLPERALKTARTEGKFEHEGWRVRKDGSRFWAYVVIDPIKEPSGDIVGFAKITRDLTERRAAEETLRRSQEQFRLLVQGVTDYAIYLLNMEGVVTSWNQGAQRIKGYMPEEIIGAHFSRFYTEEDRRADAPARALDVAREQGRFEREGWRVRKDGTRFFAHVVIDAIKNDQGELIGFAKITRDITEKREADEKLARTKEALLQSQKMDAIGRLTGGIAHDFNNLLMAVLGSLELLRKRLPEDQKSRSLLENAVKGAERGAALTKRMLAFARNQELRRQAINIPELVHGMTELLQRALGSSVTIETRFALGTSTVLADVNQLEMVLLNLVVNARDAMPGGGQIVISARDQTIEESNGLKAGRYVALSVQDCGTGMDEATLTRAAEPFFTTKEEGKGTGLGLSVVHGIAEQSGGRFVLQSKIGMGTTAEVWLPVASGKEKIEEEMQSDSPRSRQRLVILAVDDDPLILTNTVAMLEDLGHLPLGASSAAEALSIAKEDRPIDLVISDHVMPQMTGLKMLSEIKKMRPSTLAVLATGYAEIDERDTTIPRLAKPFTQTQLAQIIAQVMPPDLATGRVIPFRSPNENGGGC